MLSVLLVKRTEEPFEKMLALPGGFCCREETIEGTAFRKLKEKTGVDNPPLSLLCNLSRLGRDPRGWIMSNFRRKIAPFVVETGGIAGGAGHRPSKLFTRRYAAPDHDAAL